MKREKRKRLEMGRYIITIMSDRIQEERMVICERHEEKERERKREGGEGG